MQQARAMLAQQIQQQIGIPRIILGPGGFSSTNLRRSSTRFCTRRVEDLFSADVGMVCEVGHETGV
jgi:hypothetical protein